MWAHAEYIKLLRSTCDGRIFDMIDEVRDRYIKPGRKPSRLMVWKSNRRVKSVAPGDRLRIQSKQAFTLHWSNDEWQHVNDTGSIATPLGFEYVDLELQLTRAPPSASPSTGVKPANGRPRLRRDDWRLIHRPLSLNAP